MIPISIVEEIDSDLLHKFPVCVLSQFSSLRLCLALCGAFYVSDPPKEHGGMFGALSHMRARFLFKRGVSSEYIHAHTMQPRTRALHSRIRNLHTHAHAAQHSHNALQRTRLPYVPTSASVEHRTQISAHTHKLPLLSSTWRQPVVKAQRFEG